MNSLLLMLKIVSPPHKADAFPLNCVPAVARRSGNGVLGGEMTSLDSGSGVPRRQPAEGSSEGSSDLSCAAVAAASRWMDPAAVVSSADFSSGTFEWFQYQGFNALGSTTRNCIAVVMTENDRS